MLYSSVSSLKCSKEIKQFHGHRLGQARDVIKNVLQRLRHAKSRLVKRCNTQSNLITISRWPRLVTLSHGFTIVTPSHALSHSVTLSHDFTIVTLSHAFFLPKKLRTFSVLAQLQPPGTGTTNALMT